MPNATGGMLLGLSGRLSGRPDAGLAQQQFGCLPNRCAVLCGNVIDEVWHPFLGARGIDGSRATMRPMPGGEINDTWLITEHGASADQPDRPLHPDRPLRGRRSVLRHYRRTTDPAEISCELSAINHLALRGFPTPQVIPSLTTVAGDERAVAGQGASRSVDDRAERLWQLVDGRPAALFDRAPGVHPPERAGGYGTPDLALGVRAAQLAGELHRALDTVHLAGSRAPERDSWRQIGAFLTGRAAGSALFAELVDPLSQVHRRLQSLYAESSGVPRGLVHNDIRPPNLLIDPTGDIVALLDFDDCLQTFLGYEFGALIGNFGKDEERRVIMDRVLELITSYDAVRPLTSVERDWLPDLLIAHAGAEGVRVVSHWLAIGQTGVHLHDSYSVIQFLDLVAMRDDLAAALR